MVGTLIGVFGGLGSLGTWTIVMLFTVDRTNFHDEVLAENGFATSFTTERFGEKQNLKFPTKKSQWVLSNFSPFFSCFPVSEQWLSHPSPYCTPPSLAT